MSDDRTKLLNEVDIKELFERQIDVRHVETLAVTLTVLALAVVGSLVKTEMDQAGGFRALLNEGSGLVAFIGFLLAVYGYSLSFRLSFLYWRLERVMRRLSTRNEWNEDDRMVFFHPGIVAPKHWAFRWIGRGLTSLPIGTGIGLLTHWIFIQGRQAFRILTLHWGT